MIKTLPSNAGGVSSIPGQGTKNPDVSGCGQKVKKIVIIKKNFLRLNFKRDRKQIYGFHGLGWEREFLWVDRNGLCPTFHGYMTVCIFKVQKLCLKRMFDCLQHCLLLTRFE